MGVHARAAERREEVNFVGAPVRLQLADVLHVQSTAAGAEGIEDRINGVVRQFGGEQEQSQSKRRCVLGRSDVARNAVHGDTAKSELIDWKIGRLVD